MAKDMGLHSVLIESDCQVAIKFSLSELVARDVLAVVLDIRRLDLEMKLRFAWIRRTANGLLPFNWVTYPPNFISSVLAK